MNRFNTRTLRITTALVVLIILSVLGAWYVHMKSATAKIDVVSVSRGLSSVVPSFFGSVGSTEANIIGFLTGNSKNASSSTEQAPRLWHVVDTPVSGARFFGKGSTTIIRFVDRSTGHVLEAYPSSGTTKRITNTLIPHVYQAYFTSSSTVVLQTLSDAGVLTSVAASVQTATGTEAKLTAVSLPPNMLSLAVAPDGSKLFMLLPDGKGGSVGIVSDARGGSQKRIFFSGLSGWRAAWPANNRILLYQRASDGTPGSAFAVTPTGTITTILEHVPGLVVTETASSTRLYSTADGRSVSLFSANSAQGQATSIPLHTSAEKCVLVATGAFAYCAVPNTPPQGAFLRDWYRGAIHTKDTFWKINTMSGAYEQIIAPESELRVAVDAKNLTLSDDGGYLGFQDARDSSLWVLRIKP